MQAFIRLSPKMLTRAVAFGRAKSSYLAQSTAASIRLRGYSLRVNPARYRAARIHLRLLEV